MQKRRTKGSKLGTMGEKLERYFEGLYKGSYPVALNDTVNKDQSFLQVPLGEAKFLEMMVRIKNPLKILEIGTFRGYSTVFMARYLSKSAHIWTIERDSSRYTEIKSLWKNTRMSSRITLIEGLAIPSLKDLVKKKLRFDFFFIDANKEESSEYFKICYKQLANKGAVILIDNTLWAGEVADLNPKSNAAVHMKKLNEFIFQNFKNQAYILPGWDGITAIIKS